MADVADWIAEAVRLPEGSFGLGRLPEGSIIADWIADAVDSAALMRDKTLADELEEAIAGTLSGDLLLVADAFAPGIPVLERRKVAALERLADLPALVNWNRHHVIEEAKSFTPEQHRDQLVRERVMAVLCTLAREVWRLPEREAGNKLADRFDAEITADLGGGSEARRWVERRAQAIPDDSMLPAARAKADQRVAELALELWLLARRTAGRVRQLAQLYAAEPHLWDDIPETARRLGVTESRVSQLRTALKAVAGGQL